MTTKPRDSYWPTVLAILIAVAANMAHAEQLGELRVQLSPIRQTVLSSELAGKLTELTVKEGDTFKEGQRLAGFDCSVQRAQLNRSWPSTTTAPTSWS